MAVVNAVPGEAGTSGFRPSPYLSRFEMPSPDGFASSAASPELVAAAYYGRGRALEELAMPDKAGLRALLQGAG